MLISRRTLAVIACLSAAACSDSPTTDAGATSSVGTSSASATSAATQTPDAGDPTSNIAEDRVRDLVTSWVKAQNEGDFAGYGRFYAAKFQGVKRSGPRSAQFDRTGWLADRERMFAKPMTVAIEGLRIETSRSSARAVFTQRWSSGDYQDTGPKSLVVVASRDGKLVIAREEMLASVIAGARVGGVMSFAAFAHVVHADAPYAIVPGVEPDDTWRRGAPVFVRLGKPTVTRAAVDTARVPQEVAALSGAKVRLMGPSGVVCDGSVTGFALVARVSPHFGSVNVWTGSDGQPPMNGPAVARDAWRQSTLRLAARVEPQPGSSCVGATWSHVAVDAPPTVVAPAVVADPLRARAITRFRKLPAWQVRQRDFETYGGTKPWDEAASEPVVVKRFTLAARSWVSVAATASPDGCGGFNGHLLAIFEERGDRLAPVNTGDELGPFATLTSLVDIAGEPAFHYRIDMVERGLMRLSPKTFDRSDVDAWTYLDCDC